MMPSFSLSCHPGLGLVFLLHFQSEFLYNRRNSFPKWSCLLNNETLCASVHQMGITSLMAIIMVICGHLCARVQFIEHKNKMQNSVFGSN